MARARRPVAGGNALRFTPVLGTSYCSPAVPNSTGVPGVATATGSFFVAANDVTLTATDLPPGQFGYFLASQTQGSVHPPGSQGILCLGGTIGRFNAPPLILLGPSDSVQIDLTSIPIGGGVAVQPGESWNFQCWYRDANPGATSNFTDAVEVAFQ